MVEIVKFPKDARPVQIAEEHLAYYTPERPTLLSDARTPAPEATGLEALDLMYEYYSAA